jgi:pimeloyl-ACP methyl ester carboxylesterase
MWSRCAFDPWSQLPQFGFRCIAMDQRNGGRSKGCPIGVGWSTYLEDQMALLDHLRCDVILTVGSCIGASFQLRMLAAAQERVSAAVLLQPIGLARHTTEDQRWHGLNQDATSHWFGMWAQEMESAGRASRSQLADLEEAMFRAGVVFSVSRDQVARVRRPMLVAPGGVMYHPTAIAREVAALAPSGILLERCWERWGEHIVRFLHEHAAGHGQAGPPAGYGDK